ncbi:MAG: hypothetical protein R3Y43_02485 [Alphaproteobacteria bacterium]
MTRIPTYASQMSMINDALATKAALDLYSYQSITGLKAQNYSGYGSSASNIVSLESALSVNNNYMETNKIISTDVNTMGTSLDSISSTLSDFKSMLTSFSGLSLEYINQDQTGGELKLTDDTMSDYNGATITANGTSYTIGTDIALGSTPQELMENIAAEIPNITYDETSEMLTFPKYTLDGYSSILNVEGVETGTPSEPTTEQQQMLTEVQNMAFSAMKLLADTLNTSATGSYLFGGGVSTSAPVSFDFSSLDEFQSYYDGLNITYPTSDAAVLANRSLNVNNTGELSISYPDPSDNKATITASNTGGFLTENISANSLTSGNLTFSADKQSITSTVGGTFDTYSEGDLMVIEGTSGNNGVYKVASISTDGKTIKLEPQEGTKAISDEAINTTDNPDVVKFSSTFPLDAIVKLDGMAPKINTQAVQVTGVSADGTKLYVSVNPATFPEGNTDISFSENWSLSAQSYYQGGTSTTEKYVSESQSVAFDITAADQAFQRMFQALGEIAQGNFLDTRDISQEMNGTINYNNASDRVTSALNLIDLALFDPSSNSTTTNADFYSIQSKVNSNKLVLNNIEETQTAMKLNLENNISNLKEVDKEEAAVKALLASTQLEASYAVMQNAMNVSLLNYL